MMANKFLFFNEHLSIIKSDVPDTILAGKEYCAKIWLSDNNYKLIKSYTECDFKNSLVDTSLGILDNCQIQLLIVEDTTYFCITTRDTSFNKNYEIALLTIDPKKRYHLNIINLNFNEKKKVNF